MSLANKAAAQQEMSAHDYKLARLALEHGHIEHAISFQNDAAHFSAVTRKYLWSVIEFRHCGLISYE